MSVASPFHGLSAFPPTPADRDGRVDTEALCRLLERLCDAGVASVGLLGSTGIYAFLTREERRRAVQAAVECVRGRVPIVVGVGALRTDHAQALARDAEAAGADALLLAPVSYTPITQDEAYQHFLAVTQAAKLPLCIYNNPGTTHFTFSWELLQRLSDIETIKAVKMPLPVDGDLAGELAALHERTKLVIGYSGDWGAAEALLSGADAWYSVIGGLLPRVAVALTKAATAGEDGEVRRLDGLLEPLWQTFKAFGSLRVIYTLIDLLSLARAELPRPLLPLGPMDRQRVLEAVEPLIALESEWKAYSLL
ncbi:dihydrodipicolinate synthase family protein [Rhizobium leguminosarum bv. trifolii]|uniref:Dihydrodipicolinate synthase family protein n=1 Tax=Rhizobium ruizarguesonis TaxID=2081791 RepID=A0AAE8QDX6_9HYPH|nr:dihydrodipicolinate synthase family protein [Rhizobium ruizarguesonis]MBY5802777.1 dihydrodipicolinate synthase family protein [Rhizobium leguminosarum]NKL12438.1 dihydrodipicolinate synthase family protein [Rhizobium leguminosarum bv. viciae]QIO42610.1 dihydrodipicolinate synthase family protein [Rhizobium leguminosarum bv. trifolii]MBY5843777.1 dihydrodipicolinate synthase family protein [Rhizobium leguminosarum]MBY5894733.1 dihydrodipicolinate synthase family protein [Rhizobium leguminos